ncbi:MAG: LLM class flavin-dependent oxidoreductase [Chloroflexi bacterium]|nr:LLM class flavin-dependent oxidoreductase [Chloroflexota bacterium]|tara:strand:- start:19095 stop:20408 length:1314 start_codon:yes stop_codon:yes gene_type:complete
MSRELHLNLFINSRGHHEASWRHPDASDLALTDIHYLQGLTQRAEEGLFDSIFLADQLAFRGGGASLSLEPLTSLAALAVSTNNIGLIATASTTYTEPFNLARQFASLDHISNGRIGWNIVTSWSAPAARNYGYASQISHAERYARADEFMAVTRSLWDSWSDDAIIDDRANGKYLKQNSVREGGHEGTFYNVAGPLNVPRGPQGWPVLVQAGSSDTGRKFAAQHAEAVFTAHMEKSSAKAFYSDLKSLVKAEGRDEKQCLILPGLSPVIASTDAEAKQFRDELNNLADPQEGLISLSARFGGTDFSHLPLDTPLSPDDFPDPSTVEAARSRTEVILGVVRNERPTMRQLLSKLAGARGHYVVSGTPEHIADLIEDWFIDGVADGINLMPPVLPKMLDVFIDEVVPLLQRKGIFRTEYQGNTLRDHYGLDRPDNTFA